MLSLSPTLPSLLSEGLSLCSLSCLSSSGWLEMSQIAVTHTLFFFVVSQCMTTSARLSARCTQIAPRLGPTKHFQVLFVARWFPGRACGALADRHSLMVDNCRRHHSLNRAVGFHCVVITGVMLTQSAACIPLPAQKQQRRSLFTQKTFPGLRIETRFRDALEK